MKLGPVTGLPEEHPSSAGSIKPQRVSTLIFKEGSTQSGSWIAVDGSGRIFEGSDETGLARLGHGAWIVNLSFSDMQSLREVVGKGVFLKSQDWARTRMDLIMNEWGIEIADVSLSQSIQVSRDVFARLMDGCMETLQSICVKSNTKDVREFSKATHSFESQPSLSTFIRKFIEPSLDRDLPSGGKMRDILKASFLPGSGPYQQPAMDGMKRLRLFRPRLTHTRDVLSCKVPVGSDWQQAQTGVEDTVESILEWGHVNDRPVLLLGSASQGSVTPSMSSWIARKSVIRQVFPDIEAQELKDNIALSGAIVGESRTDDLAAQTVNALDGILGQRDFSSLSQTVGLIAENILCAYLRSGRDGFPSPVTSWFAAKDRIIMAPIWSALEMSGASVQHAYAGQIMVDMPDDAEVISNILTTAWECGLVLPLHTVADLNKRGVVSPFDRDGWGGSDEDYLLASMVHRGKRSLLWKIDGCISEPHEKRMDIVRNVMREADVQIH